MLAVVGIALWAVLPLSAGAAHHHRTNGSSNNADAGSPPETASLTPLAAIPLVAGWRYLPDPRNVGLADRWAQGGAAKLPWSPVTIPNDFNPVVSPAGYAGTVGWYELWFNAPPASAGRSWDVYFEEVRRDAEVWLNGTRIGSNSYPYAPFALPASSLEPGRPNLLVVRVDNFKGPDSLPEDWWNWGGIVDPVALEPVGRIELSELGVMPELSCRYRCGDLLVEGTLRNVSAVPLTPRIELTGTSPAGIRFAGGQIAAQLRPGAAEQVSFRVPVPSPLDLWSPGSPNLYQVQVRTESGPRTEQDDSLQVGMRSVQVRGGILYLNGRRLWLRGAAIQEDIQGRGAALTDEDIDTIVSELRSLGANVTRAHYLLDPRLLDALDQAGIMVWAQPPVDHADAVLGTAAGRAQALAALRATVLGDRNHPSVIVDSVGNELSSTPDTTPGTRSYLTQAISLARRLDPVVPVGLDIYGYPGYPVQAIYKQLDALGISAYFGWYTGPAGHSISDFAALQPYLERMHTAYPKQAIAVTEFGTEALLDGPATTRGTYAFQSSYLQHTFAVLEQLPFMNGAIYWTLQEFAVSPGWTGGLSLPSDEPRDGLHHKGLIAYNGTQKPAYAVAQQLFATQPAYVH